MAGHTVAFDALLAGQPADWSFFQCFVALADARRLNEARVALARANARPLRGDAEAKEADFAITVANTQGRGAAAGVVRSALRMLDDLGIAGTTWAGETLTCHRPAPPHRYGP